MSLLTTWGYTLTALDALPELMTLGDYETFTGKSSSGDSERVEAEISAASAAIRNYVGWHLGPSAACQMVTFMADRRVTCAGADLLIQLPARYVTGITSILIDGAAPENYLLDTNGLLRVFDFGWAPRYAPVVVNYTAAIPDDLMAPIKELIAHRVTHAIAVPPGITSEASGGVSVTYNANWINNSRATALAGDNKELLIPYRVLGVF